MANSNNHGGARRYPKLKRDLRRCLKCDEFFPSVGIYNRICPGCQESNKGILDMADLREDHRPKGIRMTRESDGMKDK